MFYIYEERHLSFVQHLIHVIIMKQHQTLLRYMIFALFYKVLAAGLTIYIT